MKTKELRGDIIERSANLETTMGAVISMVYFGRVQKNFIFDLLGDEYFSFALKRRILLKLSPHLSDVPGFEQNLGRLNTIRNYFAHAGMIYTEKTATGINERILDPRDFERSVDFPKLHKEFLEKEKPVLNALVEELKRLGGALSREP